jgi:excisionase family DNA binding protein
METFFKIGEVAKLLGLHVNTVRKLEREGFIKAERSLAGYRMFNTGAIEKIRGRYEEKEKK